MKALYIAPVDESCKLYKGISKKIRSQINAFKEENIEMDYISMNGKDILFNGKPENINLNKGKHFIFFRYIVNNINQICKEYKFVYIRFSFANYYMFKLIKKLRQKGIKVFLEIPTFPYLDEIDDCLKNKILKKIDKFLWSNYYKYIYRVVLTNDMNELFGIKAINIINAVDLNNIRMKRNEKHNDIINIICVANISIWHGYDRLVNGLNDYYKANVDGVERVELHIVGEGEAKKNLQKLTKEYGLEDYVHFWGLKFGDELDNLYNKMDIGVSSLALHRAGGGHDPIKSKEYVAKGIPVIIGYEDRAFKQELPFIIKVNGDESNINIQEIIDKYKSIEMSTKEIRVFAEKNLSWKSQINKVLREV